MRVIQHLAAAGARLNQGVGAPPIPWLFFLTDPRRTPDPVQTARRLPRGVCIIYRHFGASDRNQVAHDLATVCRRRALRLLISADPELATRCGADGVHWPERWLHLARRSHSLLSAAAHSAAATRLAADLGADFCLLSPIFVTKSTASGKPLGLFRASQIARRSTIPVIALGGIDHRNAARLIGRGFAGLAGVDAFK